MRHFLAVFFGFSILFASTCVTTAAETDMTGSRDHALIPRMPGFFISGYDDVQLGSGKFIDQNKKEVTVEGRKSYIEYRLTRDTAVPGELKIRRKIQEDLKKIGGNVLFDDNFNRCSTIVVKQGATETWVDIRAYDRMYRLTIIEKETTEPATAVIPVRPALNIDPAIVRDHAALSSDKATAIPKSYVFQYVGMNFDHQNPYNKSLTHLTIELTTPKPLTNKFFFPDVPEFQAQGYKLVISDGINTISSSDPGFSFSTIAATNRIYSIEKNGLPKEWSFYCEVKNSDRIIMTSKYTPIYSHEGGDSTTKYSPSYGPAEYSAWTLGDSHVGIPVGSGSGKGTWSFK
jgi:hypothetical protein